MVYKTVFVDRQHAVFQSGQENESSDQTTGSTDSIALLQALDFFLETFVLRNKEVSFCLNYPGTIRNGVDDLVVRSW